MPDTKNARPNIFQRFWNKIRDFMRETIGELRKVSWPSRQEALNLTRIVLIVIVAMALLLGGLDFLYTRLFGWIIG